MLLAGGLGPLELVGQLEQAEQLVAAPVGDLGEVPALQVVGDGHHLVVAFFVVPPAADRGPDQERADRDERRELDDQPGGAAVRERQALESSHNPPVV